MPIIFAQSVDVVDGTNWYTLGAKFLLRFFGFLVRKIRLKSTKTYIFPLTIKITKNYGLFGSMHDYYL